MSPISQENNTSKAFTASKASKAITPPIATPLRKVLIITYYWPPSGGAGVQRWLKTSKYLPEFGWEPVILTVDPRYASYPQMDIGLLNEISPDIKIFKTRASGSIFSIYRKITGKKEIPYGGFANESNPGLVQKTARFIRGNFFLPDARIGWNRYALKSALKIIKEENIELVITTSPPHSTQMIGLKLKNKLNIKWIADLRDPWSDIYYTDQLYQTFLARKVNRCMEKSVLNKADKVIATCNSTRDLFRTKLSDRKSNDKIITITNGFDPADFIQNTITPDKFTITYIGTYSKNYDINVLIKALDYCSAKMVKGINLSFIGKVDENTIKILKAKENISVKLIPYVEHKEVLKYLSDSAALLLVVPSDKRADEMIPGKLFEYLASKRPVIAIGRENSDVAVILKETKGGRMFDKTDYIALGDYIIEIFNNFSNSVFETEPVGLDLYSRRNLTRQITDVCNEI